MCNRKFTVIFPIPQIPFWLPAGYLPHGVSPIGQEAGIRPGRSVSADLQSTHCLAAAIFYTVHFDRPLVQVYDLKPRSLQGRFPLSGTLPRVFIHLFDFNAAADHRVRDFTACNSLLLSVIILCNGKFRAAAHKITHRRFGFLQSVTSFRQRIRRGLGIPVFIQRQIPVHNISGFITLHFDYTIL